MQVLDPRCAGLDVHKATVVACVRRVQASEVVTQVRPFATTTTGLMQLSAWLAHHGCTHVAASRKKASYRQAQFHRLRARRGAKKAVCALAASILTAAYHMLKAGAFYEDLGSDHDQRRARSGQIKRRLRRLTDLGYAVDRPPHDPVSF
jgi:hypothetical protein